MQFTGKLTQLDVREVQKIARSKWYWPKFLLSNWYGIALLAAITWGTIAGLLGQIKPNWPAFGIIWAVIAVIFGWSFYRTKRGQTKGLTELNATLPDRISLTNEGVKSDGPNGATSFLPWTSFEGWREGQRVLLIDQTGTKRFVILPITGLPDLDRQQLRGFLRSQIPSANH